MLQLKRYSPTFATILREKVIVDRRTRKPKTIYVSTDSVCAEKTVVDAWVAEKTKSLGKQTHESECI